MVVKQVHMELSSICNSDCKFCGRKSVIVDIPEEKNLSKHAMDNILISDFIKGVDFMLICGSFGDPTFNPHLMYFVDKLIEMKPDIKIDLSTNGSIKDKDWWSKMGELLSNPKKHEIAFCMDGVTNDIHQLYRKTDMRIVFENMMTFVKAGGIAKWRWIVFKQNQHQMNIAENIAKNFGIRMEFRKSWAYDDKLQKPTSNKYEELHDITIRTMDCKHLQDKEIFITVNGEVRPCCFNVPEFDIFKGAELTLETNTIHEILESKGWKYISSKANKYKKCRQMCCSKSVIRNWA